jgi:uracil-DNA glycosylase
MIDPQIESSRKKILRDEFQKPYFTEVKNFLQKEKSEWKIIYPAWNQIFNAFNQTPFDKVKVVIIWQDPYHGQWEAHGLCFSVQDGVTIPPSLRNIYKEMESDLWFAPPKSWNLTKWTQEWVFLLNATLTVRKDTPNSHKDIGWQTFTDAVIRILSEKKEHLVFILRWAFAQQKKNLIDENKHLVICSAHPSPFSANRGFFGSRPFSRTNDYLEQNGILPIDWNLM